MITSRPTAESTLVQSSNGSSGACHSSRSEHSYDAESEVFNSANIVESPQEDKQITGDSAHLLFSGERRRPLLAGIHEGFKPIAPEKISRYERTDTAYVMTCIFLRVYS